MLLTVTVSKTVIHLSSMWSEENTVWQWKRVWCAVLRRCDVFVCVWTEIECEVIHPRPVTALRWRQTSTRSKLIAFPLIKRSSLFFFRFSHSVSCTTVCCDFEQEDRAHEIGERKNQCQYLMNKTKQNNKNIPPTSDCACTQMSNLLKIRYSNTELK